MGGVLALGSVHESLVARVRAALDGLLFDVGPSGARAALTVYDGVAVQRPAYPYLIVGGSSGESPFNTLGAASGAKWGAEVSIPLRVVTQYPTTETQTYRMLNVLKGALDQQPLTVSGFASVDVTMGRTTLLSDVINGVPTRELVTDVDVLVHQG